MGNIGPRGSLDTDALMQALLEHRNIINQDTNLSPTIVVFEKEIKRSLPTPDRKFQPWQKWRLKVDLWSTHTWRNAWLRTLGPSRRYRSVITPLFSVRGRLRSLSTTCHLRGAVKRGHTPTPVALSDLPPNVWDQLFATKILKKSQCNWWSGTHLIALPR